jgi:hypothetical protein
MERSQSGRKVLAREKPLLHSQRGRWRRQISRTLRKRRMYLISAVEQVHVAETLYKAAPEEKWKKIKILGGDISESMLVYFIHKAEKKG